MNCLRAMPVCLLVNDKGIESTFYKTPRPSARVLTLSHAPTPKHDYSLRNSILLLPCSVVYYIVSVLFLLSFWCHCMAINVSIQYNGGLLPDIILSTQCYLYRGTRLNAMKKFCICSLWSHLNVFMLRRSRRVLICILLMILYHYFYGTALYCVLYTTILLGGCWSFVKYV